LIKFDLATESRGVSFYYLRPILFTRWF